jgi:hypothetical protein
MNEEKLRQFLNEDTRGGAAADQFRISTTSLHSHDGVDGQRIPFLYLSDAPSSYNGQAGRSVVVNSGATALIFSGGVLATTATTGFIALPTCVGTPTGVPAIGIGATVLDTSAGKIWTYYGGAWHFATLT